MSANSEDLPPPLSADDFESLCLDLWRERLVDECGYGRRRAELAILEERFAGSTTG